MWFLMLWLENACIYVCIMRITVYNYEFFLLFAYLNVMQLIEYILE